MSSGMNCKKHEAAEESADQTNEEAEQRTCADKSTQTECAADDHILFLPITIRVGVHSDHQESQSIDEFCIEACSKLKEILPSYCPPDSLKKIASDENDSEDDGWYD